MLNGSESDESTWVGLKHRHPNISFVAQSEIYALNDSLIDAIQRERPGFFDKDEFAFERDLVRVAPFGIFQRQVIGIGSEDVRDPQSNSFDERAAKSATKLNELRRCMYFESGVEPKKVNAVFRQDAKRRQFLADRKLSYTGWLVSNPRYLAAIESLRAKWCSEIVTVGQFPRLPFSSFFDFGPRVEFTTQLEADFFAFYRKWGLERLITWDWPLPMELDQAGVVRPDQIKPGESGILLYIPWYLLRGEKLDIQELIQSRRLDGGPDHLKGWFHAPRTNKRDLFGDVRNGRLAYLHRYWFLGLQRRYENRMRGHRQIFDRIFARALHRSLSDESVRQLRLELQRARGGSGRTII